jgi:hypothetical protein
MSKGLSPQDQEELNRISNALNLDADTKKLASTYFSEFKQKTKQTLNEKVLPLMISCAIFAAAKSQIITTVNGDTIRGVGISISQLIRALEMSNRPSRVDELLMALKDFITAVTLSSEILTELKAVIDKFAFTYTFFIKYNNLFRQLELDQPMSENEEYLRCVKNTGWLIFVSLKTFVHENRTDLIESVFSLAAILTELIYNLPKEITVPYFEKNGKFICNATSGAKDEELILEGVLDVLKLQKNVSVEEVNTHKKSVEDFLKKLLSNGTIKSTQGFEVKGAFEQSTIFMNFEKLDAYYQKKLGFDDLDERFFVCDRKAFQAGMFTPFTKQGPSNKLTININITKNGESFAKSTPQNKLLNFEASQQVSMKSNLNEIKYAGKSIPPSPFGKQVPATPVSRALEMYNWLSDKVRLKKTPSGLTPGMEEYLGIFENRFKDEIVNRANTLVEKVLTYEKENASKNANPLSEKKIKDKQSQMANLYLKVLEELLNQEERKTHSPNYVEILSNDEFHKALIACSIETVFFVNNSSSVAFPKLLELCEIQPFEFWRIIGSFAKFDPQIPPPLKSHLHSLELRIIMNLAWKKDSVVHKIIKKFIDESKDSGLELETATTLNEQAQSPESQSSSEGLRAQKSTSNTAMQAETSPKKAAKTELTHSQELFFKRVLHHTALHIYQLSDLLELKESIAEMVWSVMKYILSSETTLLIDRHIDQIVLSAIYGVCKVLHQPHKFQEIINKYQELPSFEKADFIENIHQVYINDTERADLIKFYNLIFIPQMKTYLFALAPQTGQIPAQLRPGTPQIKKPLVPALVMNSPLRESIPLHIAAPPYRSISAHAKTKTPQPNYGMTPLTRTLYAFGESPSRNLESINNLASKRQINFDDGPESNSAESNPIKEAKPTSSILGKIFEQKNEDSESEPSKFTASKINLTGIISKFSNFDEGTSSTKNANSLPPLLQSKSQLNFESPKSGSGKMSVESSEGNSPQQTQQISQTQDSPPTKTLEQAQSGFKKVKKDETPLIPELKK